MFARRAFRVIAAAVATLLVAAGALTLASGTAHAGGTGPGASGNTITNAAQAIAPFSPGTFDSGQGIDVVVPANTVFTPGDSIFIFQCAAPAGVDPTTTAQCDGNTNYGGGTITVNSDGSVDVVNGSSETGLPYQVFALPDPLIGDGNGGAGATCGLGSAKECVLDISESGTNDTGMTAPHFFSQAFQVHADATDSGTINPGDGTFPPDSAPAFTSASSANFIQGQSSTFTATATGWPPPTFSETGALPTGVTLNSSTGVLSGTPSNFGSFPITLKASNGVSPNASQSFTLSVEPGISGDQIPGAAVAISPFSPGTFDSGQGIDVSIPPNAILTPGSDVKILECAAPHGQLPTTTAVCDGNTGYGGGTVYVNSDGSVDLVNSQTGGSDIPYTVFALPDKIDLGESASSIPKCAQGSANDCVLYVGQGGGGDTGMTQPHVFSQAFQVHADPTDSGTLNPGDGTFPPDAAPAITSGSSANFIQGHSSSFTVTATGYPSATFSETGTLPTGVTLNSSTGALSGTPGNFGSFPITITASNGVSPNATQSFSLSVEAGISGDQIPGAAAAISPFSPGTFDSGQGIDVTVPPNAILTPGSDVKILECAAPKGQLPTTTASCDGNTGYGGGTVYVNSDGSVDLVNSQTGGSDIPYTVFALPDSVSLGESVGGFPRCGLGSINECVLYIGQGGGGDTGMTQPHVFSQVFQVHPDATDSGSQSPGDGTFGADVPPTITSANSTTFQLGHHGSFAVTGTGYGPPTFTESGALPAGVTLNQFTGALSGTPTQQGVFPITITASNGAAPNATQSFTLTVDAPPAITSANNTTFTEGSPGSFQVTATGTPAPTFTETGPLPTGVTLSSSGLLSGTPTQQGVFEINLDATNGVSPDGTQSFTLTVDAPPAITSANNTTFTEGSPGSFQVTATGTPAPTFTETGTLPTGVTLSSSGLLSGTPTQQGVFEIDLDATNGVSPDGTQSFTLTVDGPPTITSADNTAFTAGSQGSFQVTATGTPAPTFSETGPLPTGVTLSSSGLLSGTTTQTGTFPISIDATNGVSPDATQSFTLTVNTGPFAPTITSANNATFTQGQAGSFTVTATGNPTPTFSETGTLPSGITLSSSGLLSGTTTQSGTFPISIDATNGVSPDATQSFTLTVTQLFQISTSSVPNGTRGVAYGPVQLQAIGQTSGATVKWKKLATFPKGLKLLSSGSIEGTPSTKLVSGSNYSLAIEVIEKYKTISGKVKTKHEVTATKTLTIHIN